MTEKKGRVKRFIEWYKEPWEGWGWSNKMVFWFVVIMIIGWTVKILQEYKII